MKPDGGKYAPKRLDRRGTGGHIPSLRHHTDRRRAEAHIMLFGKRERAIRRILIVEDEPLVAFDNEHSLGEAGYEVVGTVDTLADAVEALGREGIDLVLSDIKLNGDGDGMDVARAAAARNVPVLFVTGNCPGEARSLGIGCLAKPYTDKMLRSALDTLDRKLRGKSIGRLPPGLSLYEDA
jgi:DNA-binding response OmpR family regulator